MDTLKGANLDAGYRLAVLSGNRLWAL